MDKGQSFVQYLGLVGIGEAPLSFLSGKPLDIIELGVVVLSAATSIRHEVKVDRLVEAGLVWRTDEPVSYAAYGLFHLNLEARFLLGLPDRSLDNGLTVVGGTLGKAPARGGPATAQGDFYTSVVLSIDYPSRRYCPFNLTFDSLAFQYLVIRPLSLQMVKNSKSGGRASQEKTEPLAFLWEYKRYGQSPFETGRIDY